MLHKITDEFITRLPGKWEALCRQPIRRSQRHTGFPAEYRGRPPGHKLAWLAGDECRSLRTAGKIAAWQIDDETKRLKKSFAKIAARVCTQAWLDAWQDAAFPPIPDDPTLTLQLAGVVLCRDELTVLWPALYLSAFKTRTGSGRATFDAVCLETDSRRHRMELAPGGGKYRITESPTVAALEKLEVTGGRLIQSPLETESFAVLAAQIAKYRVTGRLPGTRGNR